jgi:uncharacterized C2H2 Zn-finger protein
MEEIIKCEECGELFNNKKIKANHVRWKHRDQTFYKNKASAILKESYANRHGVIITENVTCSNSKCDKTFSIEYRTGKKKIKNFCSRSCANSRGTLSTETKQKIADSLKKELKECICKNCNKQFKYYRKKIYWSSNC